VGLNSVGLKNEMGSSPRREQQVGLPAFLRISPSRGGSLKHNVKRTINVALKESKVPSKHITYIRRLDQLIHSDGITSLFS